jgi:hypothetical protein
MDAEDIISTFLTLNIYIRLCLPKALTLTPVQSYEMFEVLIIVRLNQRVGLWGIINFLLRRYAFPYLLARGIPFKEGVLFPLQSKVRTPPPLLHLTILALQISLNAGLPPYPLHSEGQ